METLITDPLQDFIPKLDLHLLETKISVTLYKAKYEIYFAIFLCKLRTFNTAKDFLRERAIL